MHVRRRDDVDPAIAPARFGFIVPKTVGGAVIRNTVKRRLRAAGHSVLPAVAGGTDVVVRALPGSHDVPWTTLQSEIADGLRLRDLSGSVTP
jgi:ribonuclease P protein component